MAPLPNCWRPKETPTRCWDEAIESRRLIRAGRSETEVDQDIFVLAEKSFGVRQHWHKRIVRAGANTVCFAENPPVREIANNDTVFLDLGPVFGEWEANAAGPMSWAMTLKSIGCAGICQEYSMRSSNTLMIIAM